MKLLLFSAVAALTDVDKLGIIGDYHLRSSHTSGGYCPMPDKFDWPSMPGPRVYYDSERYALPLSIAVDAAPAASVSALLLACCGASGVKGDGENRWYVRSNPSSGNLHPVETYVLLNQRLYHYDALSHSLELRGANASAPVAVSKDAVVVLLSAISWREEWKYGLRGPRYTYLDAGHAIGAVLQAARAFGWTAYLADHLSDTELAALLGIGGLEAPVAAIVLDRRDGVAIAPDPAGDVTWYGAARPLAARSWSHPAADALASAVGKPATPRRPYTIEETSSAMSAEAYVRLARRRRTALAFARNTTTRAAFFEILNSVVDEARRFEGVPATASPLLVLVHGVDGIAPGTYLVNPGELLTRVTSAREVSWPPEAYLISAGDVRAATAAAACHQAIAGDAAFVVAFLADMGAVFEPPSPYMYPRLFWQAGALGQRLYLAATARGLGASGIGCFFDDAVHAFLSLEDQRFQALYLVAVGAALPDERLLAEDPFVALRGEGVSFTV